MLQTLQQSFAVIHLFFKWANPGLFLFNFVLFKYKFNRKTVSISGNQTRTVGEEGEHADHLTTTTALLLFNLWRKKLRPIRFTIYHLATLRCRRYQVSLTSWLVYLFDIWPFVTMKMCQSRFKIEPNIIWTSMKLHDFLNFTTLAKFIKITSHWWYDTMTTTN